MGLTSLQRDNISHGGEKGAAQKNARSQWMHEADDGDHKSKYYNA